MDEYSVVTPVVMIIFNRPDTTARVFAEVARVRPSRLLVIADGPRGERPDEAKKCAAARFIFEQIDWPCQVHTNFAVDNMGCKQRVASGLDWVFELVEEAIILEDDCLPDPSFFRFCDELLARYRRDERVMMISGDNFQQGKFRGNSSYYFSRYCHVWGWATWQRAWQWYDVNMADWPAVSNARLLHHILDTPGQVRRWTKTFDIMHSGVVDTWDLQWMYTCWRKRGLSVIPNSNLVSNIGFGADATHTQNTQDRFAGLPTIAMSFPLKHPAAVARDAGADWFIEQIMFHQPWTARIKNACSNLFARFTR